MHGTVPTRRVAKRWLPHLPFKQNLPLPPAAVRGDFWVSKDFTTAGKVIARSGLVAKTCSCSNRY